MGNSKWNPDVLCSFLHTRFCMDLIWTETWLSEPKSCW